eukprot:symbB.v1.2.005155.t1/scaffold297.1/size245286/8
MSEMAPTTPAPATPAPATPAKRMEMKLPVEEVPVLEVSGSVEVLPAPETPREDASEAVPPEVQEEEREEPIPVEKIPEIPAAPDVAEVPEEPEVNTSTPSTPASKISKDESPSGAPKLSSWLTDMRSRMANKQPAQATADPEKQEAPTGGSKFAPSSSLRPTGRLAKPPKPPKATPSPEEAKEAPVVQVPALPSAVPPLPLQTVQEEETPGIVRCSHGNISGASSKTSANESTSANVPGEDDVKETLPVQAVGSENSVVQGDDSQSPSMPPNFMAQGDLG